MSRFLKIEGENAWVNVQRVDAIALRPQLSPVSQEHSPDRLEDLHESTGRYEVVTFFDGRLMPIRTCTSLAEAEAFVNELLHQLNQ